MNRGNPAVKRILADVKELQQHPSCRYHAAPTEDNMFGNNMFPFVVFKNTITHIIHFRVAFHDSWSGWDRFRGRHLSWSDLAPVRVPLQAAQYCLLNQEWSV